MVENISDMEIEDDEEDQVTDFRNSHQKTLKLLPFSS
jgi:hypothetical protein